MKRVSILSLAAALLLVSLMACAAPQRSVETPPPTPEPTMSVTPTPTATPTPEPTAKLLVEEKALSLADLTQDQLALFQTIYDTYNGIGLGNEEALQLELYDIAYQVHAMALPTNGEALYQEWRLANHPVKGDTAPSTGTTTPSKPITDAPKPGQSQTDNANNKPSTTNPGLSQGEASDGKYTQTIKDPQTGKDREAVFKEDGTFDHWVGNTNEAITDPTITDKTQEKLDEIYGGDSSKWDEQYDNWGS